MNLNRRKFISGMATAMVAMPVSGVIDSLTANAPLTKYPVAFFTKTLDNYELDFMAETLALAGITGFDLAVRPNGRVLPERVRDDLPMVIETGKKYQLTTEMMVTSIRDADEPFARQVLETAASLGVKHYRLGYFDYNYSKGILVSLNEIRPRLEQLAQINKEFGIQAAYQNHSGIKVGAPMWDVWELIKDFPFKSISSQFDIRHAVTEASSSWILSMHLLHKFIGSLAVKDFTWQVSGGKAKIVSVPLGEGIVDFDLFFKTIKDLNITAPFTLHIEYPLLTMEEENLTLLQKQKILVSKIKKDVNFIRNNLDKS